MRSNCRLGAFPRDTTQLSGAGGEDEAVYERASGSKLLTGVLGVFLRCAFILSLIEIRCRNSVRNPEDDANNPDASDKQKPTFD
jgi:hypothetical protein